MATIPHVTYDGPRLNSTRTPTQPPGMPTLMATETANETLTVLQILPALDGGGVELATLEVSAELARQGHRSLVISAGGQLVERLEREGGEHITWPIGRKSPLALRWIGPLRRLLRDEHVDVIHVRSRIPAWVTWLAWRRLPKASRPRLVTTVHGLYSVSRYSSVMTKGEAVIAVSETVREYIQCNYPDTNPSRVHVICEGTSASDFPYGYHPDTKWRRAFDEQFPLTRNRKLITLPGRLTRLKGHHDFLRLIAALRHEGQLVHGLIVGGVHPRKTKYADDLHQRVRSMGLSSDITFTGNRDDMRDIYAISDVVLSLSNKPESFGRTVIEALSLGVPVIGYDHGGVGEVLGNTFPTGAVPKGDVEALRASVTSLLKDASSANVPRLDRYALADTLDQTVNLYRSLVA
jgi:glycosyltransferase involved in cell wall biosynthesis